MSTQGLVGPTVQSRVTLAAVARQAGVSLATASKVLNGRDGVGADTRQRVSAILTEVGYVAQGATRFTTDVPLTGASLVILVDSVLDPYTSAVLAGVLDEADVLGTNVVIRQLHQLSRQNPTEWAEGLLASGGIGVVEVSSEFSAARREALHDARLPVVLIDPIGAPSSEMLSVGATNWAGGMAATEHLLSLGHRRIGYIGGPLRATCDQARGHGYLAAMRGAGIRVNLDTVPHGSFSFDHGLVAGTSMLTAAERPTAIFAGSDRIALGVLEAARTLGLRTPQDLSIVGFDDTLLAGTSAPRLTTIHQPIEEIGRTAVRVIVGVITGDDVAARPVELSTHLVIRDSTAPMT